MQLAEFNVGHLRYPIDDPRVRRFVMALDTVNEIAERMPGFVWRLKGDSGNATEIQVYDDPKIVPNLSVWTDIGSLENFVWKTVHKTFYERREQWFEVLEKQNFVMWPVEDRHEPTLAEAKERLDHLNQYGDSDQAFGWSYAPQARLWLEARCA
ncbi:MAG: hypothetical protein JWL86_5324 [Rhizobium sp.]|nr:hypothetical protein [Rhizobium sp.]